MGSLAVGCCWPAVVRLGPLWGTCAAACSAAYSPRPAARCRSPSETDHSESSESERADGDRRTTPRPPIPPPSFASSLASSDLSTTTRKLRSLALWYYHRPYYLQSRQRTCETGLPTFPPETGVRRGAYAAADHACGCFSWSWCGCASSSQLHVTIHSNNPSFGGWFPCRRLWGVGKLRSTNLPETGTSLVLCSRPLNSPTGCAGEASVCSDSRSCVE